MSLEALGEDESETETFLQSLNAARKNTLVKCNLQYVLSALDNLGEREAYEECKSESKFSDYRSESSKQNRTVRYNSIGNMAKNHNYDDNSSRHGTASESGTESGTGTGRHSPKSLRSLSQGDEIKERDIEDQISANRTNKFRK